MPKRKNNAGPTEGENGFSLLLFPFFPFFLIVVLGLAGDSFPAVLSPVSSAGAVRLGDGVLVFALLNTALAAVFASQRAAAFRWFRLFLFLAAALAALEGALDLAATAFFTGWMGPAFSGRKGGLF